MRSTEDVIFFSSEGYMKYLNKVTAKKKPRKKRVCRKKNLPSIKIESFLGKENLKNE